MLKVVNNSRAKKVMQYFTYQKVNHKLCIEGVDTYEKERFDSYCM